MPVQTNAMLLLAGLESTLNTDPTLTVADAIPTGKFLPGYKFDELRRLVVNKGIDAAKKLIGREMIDFNFEVELLASGVVGTEPTWGRLLEACGFTKEVLAAAAISDPIAGYGNTGLSGLAVAKGGAFTGAEPRVYKVEVTTAGASGAAKVSVTCRGDSSQNSADNTVTTATPINLGDEGATITLTFASGSLVLGDKWYVHCYPPGIRYRPTAYNGTWKTAFFYHYLGGLLFKGGGARGNFSLSAPAGEIAKMNFTFQSVFNSITDAAVPDYTEDSRVPAIVELAGLHVDDDNTLVAKTIGIETGNTIVARQNVNAAQGLDSFRISARDNQFSIDPEAKLEAEFDFWHKLREREEVPVSFKIGSTAGNIVHTFIRRAVIDNLGPVDDEDLLRYGIAGQCRPSPAGNDNIEIFVC